ncbi:hypothetical protein [Haloarcula salinisoli]|uniref:Uncharacterized protein n=1 Tax=Haloarcula salinisoli TaxID=2487746 RepID=A0A8J7YKB8_9EURY|nr:hypothetical protein [Halomicroarcula salinisoli]MBX0288118.1 hypothetical protein [Halomicroarcula salinisoli]MBX0305253.1 hypothetical protein [Halomicroarcula salinisoli]
MSESVADPALAWDWGPAHSRLTRCCLYVAVAPILGMLLGGALLALTLLPTLFSNLELLALVVLFALVGGPFSLLYLWPVLTDRDQRAGLVGSWWLEGLRPLGLAVAAVGGLGALVLSVRVAAYGPLVVVGVAMGVGFPVTGLLATRGRVDPEELTLRFEWGKRRPVTGDITVEMCNWTGLRRYRLGPVAVCLASYAPGTSGGAPQLFVVPASVASAARDSFERALATPVDEPARDGNPAVAATLAAFGLGTLAVGAGLWLLADLPSGIGLWIVAVCGTFGVLFLVLAARER